MKPRAGIYDPYLDTLGGGERYCLSVAEHLVSQGYDVDIFWSGDQDLLSKAQARFNLDLSGIHFVSDIFNEPLHKIDLLEGNENLSNITTTPKIKLSLFKKLKNIYNKWRITRQYSLFFYLSDWSIPFLFSKNNYLHIQVPFNVKLSLKEYLLSRLKFIFLKSVICNSQFTQKFAVKQFGKKKCQVIYPPVDVDKFKSDQPKNNYILSVGRFDNLLNTKRQDILITAFDKIYQQNKNMGWKLILAGGSLEDQEKNTFLKHLKFMASDLPIEFVVNPSFVELKKLYESSKIYWHAAGYEIDETLHPENTEHFGISPVEGMASGLVPIALNSGGLPEIIQDGQNGYLWETIDDLVSKTQLLIASSDRYQNMSQLAKARSSQFSKQIFSSNLDNLLKK